jgi:hypothetical protein
MATGKPIRGAIEGDAVARDFIPRMIEFYRAGQLPLEKLVMRYAFEDITQPVADTLSGKMIKPILSIKRLAEPNLSSFAAQFKLGVLTQNSDARFDFILGH